MARDTNLKKKGENMIDAVISNSYRNFSMFYPHLTKDIVALSYDHVSQELIIEVKDGEWFAYCDLTETVRTIPNDRLTEQQLRTEFGIHLEWLMRRRGMTQMELSELTGITQCNISLYLRGRITPSIYKAMLIAEALECSIDSFIPKYEMITDLDSLK